MSSLTLTKKSSAVLNRTIFTAAGVIILAIVISMILSMTAANVTFAAEAQTKATVYRSVMIQPGDTLWDLAESYKAENQTVRQYVAQVKEVNHLSSDHIVSGEYLILPVQVDLMD